ncbi:hypothetical protein SKAU_G00084700 [Synaphobranchus kaupii]|uniref:Uncharacterized protein n=1 Tax=Synaphobranchus kaupii TaxID=118154 RepID=A0A9Q1FVN8_SYNKA|nr:hypothetical protein SKAU_G00084700 [Synaphobranchus kaupii]
MGVSGHRHVRNAFRMDQCSPLNDSNDPITSLTIASVSRDRGPPGRGEKLDGAFSPACLPPTWLPQLTPSPGGPASTPSSPPPPEIPCFQGRAGTSSCRPALKPELCSPSFTSPSQVSSIGSRNRSSGPRRRVSLHPPPARPPSPRYQQRSRGAWRVALPPPRPRLGAGSPPPLYCDPRASRAEEGLSLPSIAFTRSRFTAAIYELVFHRASVTK